jgi:gas vesicle protein
MNERGITMMAAITGGILGAAAGCMLFTERGRAFRRDLEPMLDELAEELNHFRGTAVKAANVASQGWKLVNETFAGNAPRFADPHQTTPF